MGTINLTDSSVIGSAAMQNGDFLTFDALPNNKFSLIIPSLPNVAFFLQTFQLPAVTVNEVNVATRFVDYNEIGEKLNFQPFQLEFLVDKYSRNWISVLNWMKEMTVNGSTVGKSEDIVLMVGGQEFIRFVGAWPTSLSGFNLVTTETGLVYVKASLTINYDFFDYIGQFATVDSSYS